MTTTTTGTKQITITIPRMLLARVDKAAMRQYATRSDIIRQASLQYVRQLGIEEGVMAGPTTEAEPPVAEQERDFSKLAEKYPYADPDDRELLVFLDDNEHGKL